MVQTELEQPQVKPDRDQMVQTTPVVVPLAAMHHPLFLFFFFFLTLWFRVKKVTPLDLALQVERDENTYSLHPKLLVVYSFLDTSVLLYT